MLQFPTVLEFKKFREILVSFLKLARENSDNIFLNFVYFIMS